MVTYSIRLHTDKWSIEVGWANVHVGKQIVRDGFNIVLCSPDLVTAMALDYKKRKIADDAETFTEYDKLVNTYCGIPYKQSCVSKICFLVSIHLSVDEHSYDEINGDWNFYLYDEKDNRYKPSRVVPYKSKTEHAVVSSGYSPFQPYGLTKDFTVYFDNWDTQKNPILTKDTSFITFAVAGSPGQGKAEFIFTSPDKVKK